MSNCLRTLATARTGITRTVTRSAKRPKTLPPDKPDASRRALNGTNQTGGAPRRMGNLPHNLRIPIRHESSHPVGTADSGLFAVYPQYELVASINSRLSKSSEFADTATENWHVGLIMRVVCCHMVVGLAVVLTSTGCQPRRLAPVGRSQTSVNTTTSAAGTTTVAPVADTEIPPVSNNELEKQEDQDRTYPITFDDLELEMKEDSVFDPSLLTARVKELVGRKVRIRGFIYPSIMQLTGITSFPLVKNTECKFGPGGTAHHIIVVDMQEGMSTSFTVRPIALEGTLSLRPFDGPDGNTWAVYHMVGENVD